MGYSIPILERNIQHTRGSSVGTAIRCGLEGPTIEYRYQWSSGLRPASAADRLLGLRVRVPPVEWIFVL